MNKMLFLFPLLVAMLALAGCGPKVDQPTGISSDRLITETITAGTASSIGVGGEIIKMQFISPHSNVSTYTLSLATNTDRGTAETLMSKTVTNATDYIYYPRVQCVGNDAAAISGEYTPYYVNGIVTVTLTNTSANTANTGTLYLWYR